MNNGAGRVRDWKVLVVGIGGVGGYFGGLLARHYGEARAARKQGAAEPLRQVNTTFLARGAHLEAITEHGLLLNTTEQSGLV